MTDEDKELVYNAFGNKNHENFTKMESMLDIQLETQLFRKFEKE